MTSDLENYRHAKKRIQDRLMKYPNVLQVSIGTKEVEGEDTGEMCYTILVKKKVPKDKLDPEDIIPPEIDEFKTDIVPVETDVGYRATSTFVLIFSFIMVIFLSTFF